MFQELVSNITNVGVFTESFGEWISGISINSAIVFIMMIFMLVGAIDKIAGNKRGYGEKFDEGFNAMGPLAAAMAGVVAAAPVLCIILKPIIAPSILWLVLTLPCSQRHCLHVTWVVIRWLCRWQQTKVLVILQV